MNLIFQLPVSTDRSNPKKCHGIYIGGKSDAKNRSKLQQLGITHILNMTPEKDASIQVSDVISFIFRHCIQFYMDRMKLM
jgi:D-serine deaminase-like pyridoxal phosphate-dependent protein